MLQSIHIENIAIIKQIDIDFSDGFTAFTGETGAGKSIIVDSIGLLCGQRASKDLIRNGEDYALVDAVFSSLSKDSVSKLADSGLNPDEDGCLYVSRRITSDGKSVCRVNSRQVSPSVLKDISAFLINIHGQHDNQDLLNNEKHIAILDSYADILPLLNDYKENYNKYCDIKKQISDLSLDNAEKEREIDMLKFQIEEISALKLKPDEEDALLSEKKRLSNLEKVYESASGAYSALYGDGINAVLCVDKAISMLDGLSKVMDGTETYNERLTQARSEIYDVAEYIREIAENAEESPAAKLDKIEQRLYDIYKLKRKYGPTVSDILAFCEKASTRLSELETNGETVAKLEEDLKDVQAKTEKSAKKLHDARVSAAKVLDQKIESELEFLEMQNVEFKTSIEPKDFSSDGNDKIEFFVKTNAGLPFSPLSKTASGGELSRIMLAIKSVISRKDGVETLIFDEVDTGISGKTSRRIGIKLLQTAKYSQVMCVTHSAQIASLADSHFFVSKTEKDGVTYTSCRLLSDDERITETARIISGINITDSAKAAASELIKEKIKY